MPEVPSGSILPDGLDMEKYVARIERSLLLAALLPLGLSLGATYLGPKRPSLIKGEPFECGSESTGSARDGPPRLAP